MVPRPRQEKSSQADPKVVKLILDAIWKIKGQKQRPSDDQICRVMESQHGISWQETRHQLELGVRAGRILKVRFSRFCRTFRASVRR